MPGTEVACVPLKSTPDSPEGDSAVPQRGSVSPGSPHAAVTSAPGVRPLVTLCSCARGTCLTPAGHPQCSVLAGCTNAFSHRREGGSERGRGGLGPRTAGLRVLLPHLLAHQAGATVGGGLGSCHQGLSSRAAPLPPPEDQAKLPAFPASPREPRGTTSRRLSAPQTSPDGFCERGPHRGSAGRSHPVSARLAVATSLTQQQWFFYIYF